MTPQQRKQIRLALMALVAALVLAGLWMDIHYETLAVNRIERGIVLFPTRIASRESFPKFENKSLKDDVIGQTNANHRADLCFPRFANLGAQLCYRSSSHAIFLSS